MKKEKSCSESKSDILNRLNRIEGQIKGIHRMVDEEKGCADILTQIAAVRSAVNRVGSIVLERYSKSCIMAPLSPEDKEQRIEDLINTVQKFLNFVD